MIAILAACAAAATGCGSGGSDAAGDPAASATAIPATQSPTSAPSPSPVATTTSAPAGDSAVLTMKDGQGDSYTQTLTFGSPESESDVPDAISGVQTCQLAVAIPARNLVVPVQITTTLTTSVQTQIPIALDISQYSSQDSNAGLPGDVVYRTTAGDQCATDQTGAEVTLSEGQSATTQAWIVLQNAVTPAYPDGDQAQLGVNFIYFGYAGTDEVTSAQGTAVCTGDPQTQQMYSPPYLVFAGSAPSGEGCDGQYTVSGN